jgi:HEAT repeat protein
MTQTTLALTLVAAIAAPIAAEAQQPPTPPPGQTTPRVVAPAPPVSPGTAAQLADELRMRSFDLAHTDLFRQTGSAYNTGKDLLGRRDYEQAITRFDRVIADKGEHVDGALYWKAFSQYKLGRSDDSLATLAQLRRDHAQSAYLTDAKTLEADVRKLAGQPVNPAAMDDDELKILAISGIQRSDPERAVPLLEGVLSATNSLRVKRQALYVLAMSTQPRAHQILLSYAKGAGNPDLQIEAVRYLANSQTKMSSADLIQIYQAARDRSVKLAILGSSGSGLQTYSFAPSSLETWGAKPFPGVDTVRSTAPVTVVSGSSLARGRAGLLAPQDLWLLYEKETDKDLRLSIVNALANTQAVEQLGRVIRTEKDVEVRRRATRALGNIKSDATGRILTDLYASDSDIEARKTIIAALAAQNNAEGLIAIARKETSLPLKTEIVRRLSEMAAKSKVAADYLMEIIK